MAARRFFSTLVRINIDMASLRARFRVECAIDVVLEPVGEDVGPEISEDDAHSGDARRLRILRMRRWGGLREDRRGGC